MLQPIRITCNRSIDRINYCLKADPLCRCADAHRLNRFSHNSREVDALNVKTHFSRNDATHVQQIFDDLGLNTSVTLDRFKPLLQFFG